MLRHTLRSARMLPARRGQRGARWAMISVLGAWVALLLTAQVAQAAISATSPTGEVAISTPGPVLTGVATTYTVTITNTTSVTANTASIGVQLPAGVSLNHLDANCQRTNTANLPGAAVSCGFANLAPGASASATFSATTASPGTYADQLFGDLDFTSSSGTTRVVSDSVSLSVLVSPGPTDVQVTGSSNNGSPPVGSQFNYTFQVKDNGPQAAYGVSFDDTLPSAIKLVAVSSDIASCTSDPSTNTVHCSTDLLGVGQQATITITAAPTTTGTFTDFASVAMQNPDSKTSNNLVGVAVQPK